MTEQPKLVVNEAEEALIEKLLGKPKKVLTKKRLQVAGVGTLVAAVYVTGFVCGAKGMQKAYQDALKKIVAEAALEAVKP